MGLLRLAAVGLILYIVYLSLSFWLRHKESETVVCPQCDGDGLWQINDIDETCILCKGSGMLKTNELED